MLTILEFGPKGWTRKASPRGNRSQRRMALSASAERTGKQVERPLEVMPFRCYRTVGGMDTKLVSFAILGFVLIASVGSVSGFSGLVCFALVLPGLARRF